MIIRVIPAILASFGGFAVIHSLTASRMLQYWLAGRLSERFVLGWYRFLYNIVSIVTLTASTTVMLLGPDIPLYAIKGAWAWGLRVIQALGLIGIMTSLMTVDFWRFAGLRQAAAYLAKRELPLPVESLQVSGLYAVVRHPLYFFTLLLIWANPSTSIKLLVLNTAMTIYMLVGSRIEEQRLLQTYGDEYHAYQRRVSWLIPWFPKYKRSGAPQNSSL